MVNIIDERAEFIREVRDAGKLHVLIIQGNKFIRTDEDPIEDFEVASVGLMSNAGYWLWKWNQNREVT